MSTVKRRRARQARSTKPLPSANGDLADIIHHLQLAEAATYTAAAALNAQAADADPDIAITLRHHVGGELTRQIERLKALADA